MSVYAWGSNRFGQLGANITQNIQHEPIGVDVNGQVAGSVSCGEGHTIILCESGEVFTFGKGDEGQLGQGNKWKSCRVPRKVTSLEHETIVSIAAGARTSYAVTASGRVYNWGLIHIDEDQDGHDAAHGRMVGMEGAEELLVDVDAEARESSAATRRRNNIPRRVRDIVRESTERWMSASRDDDEEYLQEMQAIGYMKEEAEEKMQYRDREYHGMLRMTTRRRPLVIPHLVTSMTHVRVVQVSAGYAHCMLLSDNGTLYGSGYNDRGQLGLGHRINTSQFKPVDYLEGKYVVQVVCGHQHTLCRAVDRDSAPAWSLSGGSRVGAAVYVWGNGVLGQLGLGLRGTSKGRLWPTLITSLLEMFPNEIVDIGAGANFSTAVTSCGKVYSWGHGEYNQHGTGSNMGADYIDHFYYFYPRRVDFPTKESEVFITSIQCGDNFSIATAQSGELYSWGWHDFGVLGHGKGFALASPTPIALMHPSRTGGVVQSFGCGPNHVVAVVSSGSEWSKAFSGLVNNCTDADAALIVSSASDDNNSTSEIIYCHKAILAARCKYFASYLRAADNDESCDLYQLSTDSGERSLLKIYVDSPHLNRVTAFALLDYIYTDKFSVTSHKRAQLAELALFLGLSDLATSCSQFGINRSIVSTFRRDMLALVNNRLFSDVVFTCSGGEEAAQGKESEEELAENLSFAHSIFLKRLPYFDIIFSGVYFGSSRIIGGRKYTEICINDVLLDGISRETFLKILAFIYSGFIDAVEVSDLNDLMELLVTSNHLGITRLASHCEKEISLQLVGSPENLAVIYKFAEDWNITRLIKQCQHAESQLKQDGESSLSAETASSAP